MSEPGPPTEGHDHTDDPPFPPLPEGVGQADHQFGGGYLYVRGEVIVDSADLGRFRAAIERLDLAPAEPVQTSIPGLVRYQVARRADSPAEDDPQLIPRLVTELRAQELDPVAGLAPIRVWPHHVLGGAGHARGVTVGPPVPAEALEDVLHGKTLPGAGVTVAVLDTGLIEPAPDWFGGCIGVMRGPDDLEGPPFEPTFGRRLRSHAGHGSFVAGIIRQHAPGARILMRKVLDERGVVTDHDLATALLELLDLDVQLVNLSLGGYGHDAGGLPLTEAAIETLRVKRPELVIVASAGNDGVDQPFYPAALKDVIGVAALDRHGERACFSNYGPWVDAAAAGVRAVSAFFDLERVTMWPAAPPDCLGEGDPGEVSFHGFAAWSGTSAAAPRVTGAIAAAMGPGVDARQAAFDVVGSVSVRLEIGLGAIVQPPRWG